jgi:hypothetical protein
MFHPETRSEEPDFLPAVTSVRCKESQTNGDCTVETHDGSTAKNLLFWEQTGNLLGIPTIRRVFVTQRQPESTE